MTHRDPYPGPRAPRAAWGRHLAAALGAGLLCLSVTSCASRGGLDDDEEVSDPLESMNRGIHSFNEGLDDVVMQPIARGYVAVTPRFVRTGVRNFFSNLNDVTVVANDALQLKGEQSAADFMRLAVNSTLGLFGVLDIASEMGLRKHEEDFGQTLGYWGVDSGPYVVLPFFGPSSVRDAGGLYVDMEYADLVRLHDDVAERNIASFVRVVSRRADLLDAKQAVDAAALDSYEFMRDFYLERRRHQVTDGKSQDE